MLYAVNLALNLAWMPVRFLLHSHKLPSLHGETPSLTFLAGIVPLAHAFAAGSISPTMRVIFVLTSCRPVCAQIFFNQKNLELAQIDNAGETPSLLADCPACSPMSRDTDM